MNTKLVTNNLKYHQLSQLIESINEAANSQYYLFVGNHKETANTSEAIEIFDCEAEIFHDVYNNMIVGKRIAANNIAPLVRNIEYMSNTQYAMYDHRDTNLSEKDFFVKVDEGSYSHVYKCLDNNNNGYSTSQPTFSHISGSNTEFYRTADGYVWKYMYSYDSSAKNKFETEDLIPVIANTSVSSNAIANRIAIIKVEGQGRKYDNYVTGTLANFDLEVGGNAQIYQISNSTAKSVNGFYTGCLMYISSGTGSGQYKRVHDYYSNSAGKYAVIQTEFSIKPTNGSQYEIYPEVLVNSDGRETSNVVARALINALSTNSVYRVEIFEKGNNYHGFATANIVANTVVGVQSDAEVIPILPPYGGHGYNAGRELYSNKVEISIQLSNTEGNTIPAVNNFKQLGIIKDPLFANVGVVHSNNLGTFLNGEVAYKISPAIIYANSVTDNTTNSITLQLDKYYNNLSAGDKLFLFSNSLLLSQLATLGTIVSNTEITITTNSYFTASDVEVYKANETSFGNVIGSNTSTLFLEKVRGTLSPNNVIIGSQSGAKLVVNNVIRSKVAKYFDTFVGMHALIGNVTAGVFLNNETMYQYSLNNANAVVHSVATSNTETLLYFTSQQGPIDDGNGSTCVGNTSLAEFLVEDTRYPEIEYGSGEVLFVENVEPVTRSANTTEQFQIIFEY